MAEHLMGGGAYSYQLSDLSYSVVIFLNWTAERKNIEIRKRLN